MFYNIKGHWKTTLGQERFQKAKNCQNWPGMHAVKNANLVRHPLKMGIMIFALLSNFMNYYTRIYLLGLIRKKYSSIFFKIEQKCTIKVQA